MHFPAALLVTFALGSDPVQDAPASPLRAQQAVEGALAYLTQEGTKWVQEQQCAACHHTPWLLWAAREARRAGYAFDEAAVAEASAFTYASDNRAKLLRANNLNMDAVYVTLATGDEMLADTAVYDTLVRLVAHAVSKQEVDGSWTSSASAGRPPLIDNKEVLTLLAYLALSSPAVRRVPDQEALATARERALAWLEANPHDDDNEQSDALRLVALVRRQRPPEEVVPAIERLLAWQRSDGGFPQTHEHASDAFATGQALFALSEAGISHDDARVMRAVSFLVNTRQAEGSWAMLSRPDTIGQPGCNSLVPITYNATGWATIGLARSAPR